MGDGPGESMVRILFVSLQLAARIDSHDVIGQINVWCDNPMFDKV